MEKLRSNLNLYIYQNWKPKEWERKTWITSIPKIERKRKAQAEPSVQMGGSGELSLRSIRHRLVAVKALFSFLCSAVEPLCQVLLMAMCSCSHVCVFHWETMERLKVRGLSFIIYRLACHPCKCTGFLFKFFYNCWLFVYSTIKSTLLFI